MACMKFLSFFTRINIFYRARCYDLRLFDVVIYRWVTVVTKIYQKVLILSPIHNMPVYFIICLKSKISFSSSFVWLKFYKMGREVGGEWCHLFVIIKYNWRKTFPKIGRMTYSYNFDAIFWDNYTSWKYNYLRKSSQNIGRIYNSPGLLYWEFPESFQNS